MVYKHINIYSDTKYMLFYIYISKKKKLNSKIKIFIFFVFFFSFFSIQKSDFVYTVNITFNLSTSSNSDKLVFFLEFFNIEGSRVTHSRFNTLYKLR